MVKTNWMQRWCKYAIEWKMLIVENISGPESI